MVSWLSLLMIRFVCGALSEEAVRARMQHQMSQEELAQRADFLIYNDEAHPLIPQLDSLFDKLLD